MIKLLIQNRNRNRGLSKFQQLLMFFKSTKLGSINGVFELSAGAGWIRLHGTDCKEKLNMVEHHTDERVKGLIDWFKSLPMPFLISVTSWVGVELSVLHRLMFRLSHFRMCHESLLGKSCSALWSLAVTHNTVSRFMCSMKCFNPLSGCMWPDVSLWLNRKSSHSGGS